MAFILILKSGAKLFSLTLSNDICLRRLLKKKRTSNIPLRCSSLLEWRYRSSNDNERIFAGEQTASHMLHHGWCQELSSHQRWSFPREEGYSRRHVQCAPIQVPSEKGPGCWILPQGAEYSGGVSRLRGKTKNSLGISAFSITGNCWFSDFSNILKSHFADRCYWTDW